MDGRLITLSGNDAFTVWSLRMEQIISMNLWLGSLRDRVKDLKILVQLQRK